MAVAYNPYQALRLIKAHSLRAFDESIDVNIKLTANPKRGDHIIRGVADMPSGLGKTPRFAVLCPETLRERAAALGALTIDPATIFASI